MLRSIWRGLERGTRDPKADRQAYRFVSLEVDLSLNDEHTSYPLLHYKPPHTWWLTTTTIFFLFTSLRVSWEVP